MASLLNNTAHRLELEDSQKLHASFIIEKKGIKLAELDVLIAEGEIVASPMEISGKNSGQLRKELFLLLVSYARENYLKVIAVDNFIRKRLIKHQERYVDILE